jgi:zinc transporter ZupT
MLHCRLGFTSHEVAEFHVAKPLGLKARITNMPRRALRQSQLTAIIEPVIAIAACMAFGNSRLITVATKIAATGRTITK